MADWRCSVRILCKMEASIYVGSTPAIMDPHRILRAQQETCKSPKSLVGTALIVRAEP